MGVYVNEEMLNDIGKSIIGGVKMNWLLILVIVVLAFYSLNGRRRGLIKTVFIMFSTIISLVVTGWIAPVVSKEVQKNDRIISSVSDKVGKVLDFSGVGTKISDEVNFIDKLSIPSAMKNALLENNTKDIYVAMAVDNFKEYVCNYLTRTIINAAVFLIIFIIVRIALIVISQTLDLISKLPVLNGLNKTAGLLAGFFHGIIIIWVGCLIITVLGSTPAGQYFFAQISNSTVLSTIYNNNLLLRVITNIGESLF